jgi:SAM-dependent methyltransferase
VLGVDASPEMVAAARARGIEVLEGSAESLPCHDSSFDAVFSNAALHWVRGQDAMMDEVRRVLKPGGRFVAEMGGHGNIAAINVAFSAVLARHLGPGSEDAVNYFPTPQSYALRLSRHGFHVDRIALIPRPTPLPASGMDGWLRTFRSGVLNSLREELREKVIAETCALLAPALRDENGNWTGDYVRLRFIATIPNG